MRAIDINNEFYDFSNALIISCKDASPIEQKAVEVLQEEVFIRTGLSLKAVFEYPGDDTPIIVVGCVNTMQIKDSSLIDFLPLPGREGFRLSISSHRHLCIVQGMDERAVLYGVGRLLRMMNWKDGFFKLPKGVALSETPAFRMRGHQLAYRPKTNAYDAWSPEIFNRYIRELALFGANTIEILPPGTDDESVNTLMKYDPLQMMITLSEIIHSYGLETSVWFPNMFGEDVSEEQLLREDLQRKKIFSLVPYIDHIFIPGGDPGKLFPKMLFMVSQRFIKIARLYHPDVKLWISPQTFCPSEKWTGEFYSELAKEPEWLDGVCFAPWERDNIDTLREKTPARYPIRNYPDICHTLRCQYPVPKWNITQAMTLGREFVNPRPLDEKHIHNLYCKYMVGSVCYSEGINDDLNKFIWLDQEWNPETPAKQTLMDYGRLFIQSDLDEDIARGMLLLEENLRGDFAFNPSVKEAYLLWRSLEERLCGYAKDNYRFELHLLRALFDFYQQKRFIHERELEDEALCALSQNDTDIEKRIDLAREILYRANSVAFMPELAEKINFLADSLFEKIGAQLTVTRHHAAAWDRGAFVECLNIELNDSRSILNELSKAEQLQTREEKEAAVKDNILLRTSPGEGGFYDDFGSDGSRKRLEGHENYKNDPGFFKTPFAAYLMPSPHIEDDPYRSPLAWRQGVSTLYREPLIIRYEGLNPNARYTIQTVYARFKPIRIRLYAGENGDIKIHDEIKLEKDFTVAKNLLPKYAYKDGRLKLWFTVPDGDRGPNVSEIIIRKIQP